MDQNSSREEQEVTYSDIVVGQVKVAIVQVLVWFFMYIDILMLFTFFSKQAFRGNARYILFAYILLMDSIYLLLTNLVLMINLSYVLFPMVSCILLCIFMEIVTNSTPLTIAAMCLERYVAICMPLRHTDIVTTSRTLAVLIYISAYSAVRAFLDVFILIVIAPPGYFAQLTVCYYDVLIITEWHRFMQFVFYQVDITVIVIVILFCYVKITLAARTASGENKQSASKGRRTLLLHALQLFLCVADKISPYTENIVLEHNIKFFRHILYINFLIFGLISRAMSSIIYGFRDKAFFLALLYYATCKFNHNIEP